MPPQHDSKARKRECMELDYDDYRAVRNMALGIGDHKEVLPTRSWFDVDFTAIDVSTSLEAGQYSPLCREVHVGWKAYGRKEKLLIEIREKTLRQGSSMAGIIRQFGMTTKEERVVHVWRAVHLPQTISGEQEFVEDSDQLLQSIAGAMMIHELFRGPQNILHGDCDLMIQELEEFSEAA